MDNNCRLKELPEHSATSLAGLYTDFDGWVNRFNTCYKRSTYFTQEISTTEDAKNYSRQNRDDILENDFVFSDILLRQRRIRDTAKKPSFSFFRENDGFVFYDHVFYGLMNKNGDRRIICQYVRAKL